MFDWNQIFGRKQRKTDGNLNQRQKRMFEKRERNLSQPEWNRLKRKLLNIGGKAVVPPTDPEETPESFLNGMLNKGQVINLSVEVKNMKSSDCHKNSAKLWKEENADISTGFSLSEDGLWRLHSWAVKNRKIIETTVPREIYYGVVLTGKSNKLFAESEGVV